MVLLRDFLLLIVTASLAVGLGWLGINALTSRDETEPPAQTKGTEFLFDPAQDGTEAPLPEPAPSRLQDRTGSAAPPASAGLVQETASASPPRPEEGLAAAAQPPTGTEGPAPPPAAAPQVSAGASAPGPSSKDQPGSLPAPAQGSGENQKAGLPQAGTEPAPKQEPGPEAAQTEVSVARVREVGAGAAAPGREPPSPGPSLSKDQKELIEKLLVRAERDMKAHRLTTPEGNNARDKYERILALDPGNQEAREGLEAIVRKYLWLAKESMDRRLWARAGRFIARAEKVLPDDSRIPPVKEMLARNRNEG